MGLSGRMATGDLLAACRLRREWQSESRTPRDRLEGAGVSEDKAIWGQPWQCIQGWGHQEEEAKEQQARRGWAILGQMLRSPGVVGSPWPGTRRG